MKSGFGGTGRGGAYGFDELLQPRRDGAALQHHLDQLEAAAVGNGFVKRLFQLLSVATR